MSAEFGPYRQMGRLAQQMAAHFQKDENLALEPLVAHFMDEVEVNVAADRFNHAGFIERVRSPLQAAAEVAENARRKAFLQALADALQARLGA